MTAWEIIKDIPTWVGIVAGTIITGGFAVLTAMIARNGTLKAKQMEIDATREAVPKLNLASPSDKRPLLITYLYALDKRNKAANEAIAPWLNVASIRESFLTARKKYERQLMCDRLKRFALLFILPTSSILLGLNMEQLNDMGNIGLAIRAILGMCIGGSLGSLLATCYLFTTVSYDFAFKPEDSGSAPTSAHPEAPPADQ
ncbi:hypothetical protein [Cerasicoccus maritimus]|uniref:hypothetical protein n=1 Tax=Cerasicoccus maritimus TaxID=490089 RepID=UPI002852D921|nr:hypothetical protein [Cerasicoccus maritimus]